MERTLLCQFPRRADRRVYLFVLENEASRQIVGTANIFSRVGVRLPFYSYKLSRLSHVSRGAGRSFSTQMLTLVNDFDGASEVGGLFLHPEARSGGLGSLLSRAVICSSASIANGSPTMSWWS